MAESFVRDIMDAEPASVLEDTPVEEVIHVMREHELPGIPVVNEGGRCVGIITESDLVIADEEGDLHIPHTLELFGGQIPLESLRRFEDRFRRAVASKAGDMMSDDLTTVEPDATVHRAARIISESGHNRLPVVEHGRLVGVVTRVDVLDALTRE
jgi:CBS domain-containing protein